MGKFKTAQQITDEIEEADWIEDKQYSTDLICDLLDKEYISREDHLIELQKQRRAYVKRIKQLERD